VNPDDLFHSCPGWYEPHRFEARKVESAEKKAHELTDLGWFEVQIEEEAQIAD
jgi:hypothetical protein